jgi:hypothetical protein
MNQKTVVELKKICRNMNITTKEKNKKQLIQSIQYKKRKNNMQSNKIYRKMKVNELKKICTSNKITTSNKNKTQLIQSIQKYENKKIMMGGAIERNLTGNDTTFTIDSKGVILCRHGHSCSNLTKYKSTLGKGQKYGMSNFGKFQSSNEKDTPLNRYGFYQAKKLNEYITLNTGEELTTLYSILTKANANSATTNLKIYCSPLRRCIQTAMVVLKGFYNLKVEICPYVMEKKRSYGYNNDNSPFWILEGHDRTWETYKKNYLEEQNKIKFIKEYINNFIETSDTAIGDLHIGDLHIEDSTVYPTFSTQDYAYTDSDFSKGPQADKFRNLLSSHSNELVLVFTHSGFITDEYLGQDKKNCRGKTEHYAVNTQMNFIPSVVSDRKYRVLYPRPPPPPPPPQPPSIKYNNERFITVDLEMNIDDLKNSTTTKLSPPKYISFDFDKKDKIQELITEGYDIIGNGCSQETRDIYGPPAITTAT